MNNRQIAELLRAISAAYEIKGSKNNRFRTAAYDNAADAVEHLSSEAKDIWEEGKLEQVSGIGESISRHMEEVFIKGTSKHFEKILGDLPPAMFELLKLNGVGPRRAYQLSRGLKINNKNPIQDLEKKAKKGKVAQLEGFGKESEADILSAISEYQAKKANRMLLPQAENIAAEILNWMKKAKEVEKIETLGSLRRRASTVGDIDLAVATKNPKAVLAHFVKYPKALRILGKGDHKASIVLPNDIQVDLMTIDPDSFGSLLQHFTGSKHHNIALRQYAQDRGLSLSEYGIRKLQNKSIKTQSNSKSKLKKFKTEEGFYNFLGLKYLPPELREDMGEIEASLRQAQGKPNGLPNVVKLSDIKADLQLHSSFNIETSHDLGNDTMEKMTEKANQLGYEYIAFTEHNPSQSGHSEKDIVKILKHKKEKVLRLNENKNYSRVKKVFNSLEIDILPDGSLPVSDRGLEFVDFALVSIHSSFRKSRREMTRRVLRALKHPKVKIFAHPTGRILNRRESIELDWEEIFQFCLDNSKWVEINASPKRLDLPDYLVREAVKCGVKLTLGTDAHNIAAMDNMKYGVDVAQRGWAQKSDIINTRSLKEFELLIFSL